MKQMKETDAQQVKQWLDAGTAVLIDVREAEELVQARVPDAVHNPMSAFDTGMLAKLDGKRLVFMCAMGMRSLQVGTYLLQNDMVDDAYNLSGGIQSWAMAGLPVETG
jgi:rhodanese-related sulfurtransferase